VTAEVVIGNGFGVAIAADTATSSNRRTYAGAKKIIGLPLPHSMAVVHTGKVLFHGVPYVAYIENWIQTLPPKRLNRVEDYMDSFIDFVKETIPTFASEIEIRHDFMSDWWERLHDIYHDLRQRNQLKPNEIQDFFDGYLSKLQNNGLTEKQIEWGDTVFDLLGEGSRNNVLEEHFRKNGSEDLSHCSIEGAIKFWFGDETNEAGLAAAISWARHWLSKWHPASSRNLITFVGLGEKEFLPVLDSHDFEGLLGAKLFAGTYRRRKAVRSNTGYTLFETFGQDREIRRFVQEVGLDPGYSSKIVKEKMDHYRQKQIEGSASIDTEFTGGDFDDSIEIQPSVESSIIDSGPTMYEAIQRDIFSNLQDVVDQNEGEIRENLSNLNLANCASIAARFAHLQNLAFEVQGELPTVGSKIVVAVITKAEGFYLVDPISGEPLSEKLNG
jgi:hypothetical protein